MEALGRRDDTDVVWCGNGWHGYDSDESAWDNIRGKNIDLLVVYKPEDHHYVREVPIPVCEIFNEAWWGPREVTAEDRVARHGIDFVIHHHQNDADKFGLVRAYHIPHCASREVFAGYRFDDRPCILTGVISEHHYPLRQRWWRLAESYVFECDIRPHPGYRLPTRDSCEAEIRAYAEQLRHSRIALCCTSRYRYALAKIVECMMAGCMVISDMPDDGVFQNTLGKWIIDVTGKTDDELIQTVRYYSRNPGECREIARAGQREAVKYFTMDHWAERFRQVAVKELASCEKVGARG